MRRSPLIPLMLALAGCLPDRAAGAQTPATGPVVIAGKLDTATGQLLIPVRINEASVWCSLDSGFSALIVVDPARIPSAALPPGPAVPTPDGQPPSAGDAGARASVIVGGVNLGDRSIILRRLPAAAPDMECIMGVSALRRFVVELDYSAARVRLHDRNGYQKSTESQEIPLIFRTNPNVPFVQVVVTLSDGTRQPAQLVADTGASYYAAAFVPPFARNVRARIPRTAGPPNRPESSGGGVQLVAARPAAIAVGPFSISEPVVALVESGIGGGVDDGLLGCGFFGRFTVAFDFEGRRMFLAPNNRFTERHTFDASGVGFRRSGAGYEVDMVLPDSPAARAGLREGDRLLELDGRDVSGFTAVQLRDIMSRPGETRDLRLERSGQTLRLALRLEDRL